MSAAPSCPSRRRVARAVLFTISLLLFASAGLAAAEWFLSRKQQRISRSEKLDPNLVQHDPELGWRLTPNWRGTHRHHDFTARYSINERGFRADTEYTTNRTGKLYAVLGDSFTFGIGVNDDQTFVHLLNKAGAPNVAFLNCAIPGFSTDQQALLLEREILPLKPDGILLFVYLANDLFDNQWPIPIQVNGAKPYFKLENNQLELKNSPVSAYMKGGADRPSLSMAIWGTEGRPGFLSALGQRSLLFSALRDHPLLAGNHLPEFQQRFEYAADLFSALIQRMRGSLEPGGIPLQIILLAGKSFVEGGSSVSAQYQEALRHLVIRKLQDQNLPQPLDLADLMRQSPGSPRKAWFFPNDGHLTPAGHAELARLLSSHLLPRIVQSAPL